MRMRIGAVVLAAAVGAAGAGVVTACSTPAAGSAATGPAAHSPSRDAAPAPATEGSAAAWDSRAGEPSSSFAAPASRPNCCRSVPDTKRSSTASAAARLAGPNQPTGIVCCRPPSSIRGIRWTVPSRQSSSPAPARRYPLVVFAHGFNTNPEDLRTLSACSGGARIRRRRSPVPDRELHPWGGGGAPKRPEMAAQMEDMSAVIDAVDEWAAQPSHWLHGAATRSLLRWSGTATAASRWAA